MIRINDDERIEGRRRVNLTVMLQTLTVCVKKIQCVKVDYEHF